MKRKSSRRDGGSSSQSTQKRTKVSSTAKVTSGPTDQSQKMVLHYHADLNMTGGAGTALQVFRGNSLYDPDFTNVGHQPNLFDQMAALYNHYFVEASSITVRAINMRAADPVRISLYDSRIGNIAPLSADSLAEQPRCKTALLTHSAGSKSDCVLYSTQKTQSYSPGKINPYQEGAAINADPDQPWYWLIYAYNNPGLDVDCQIAVDIKFKCMFWERVVVGES